MTSRCWKNGLHALRMALWTGICWSSAVARVTSVKSLSVHRCRRICGALVVASVEERKTVSSMAAGQNELVECGGSGSTSK